MKISELPTASSVDGTEIVPVVQSGVTKGSTLTIIKDWIATALSFLKLDFTTGQPDPAAQAGRLFWDDNAGVLAFYNAATSKVEISQTLLLRARNATGGTLTKGTVVYINGAIGQLPTLALADADSEATSSKTIGLLDADISNNSNGYVLLSGVLHNVDTSAFVDGDALWLSAGTAGTITATRPAAPNHAVFLGYCAYSHATQGKIIANIQNGYELDELHDVSITGVAALQMLRRNAGNTAWENFNLFGTVNQWTSPQRVIPVTDNDLSFDLAAGFAQICTPTAGGALTYTNIPAGAVIQNGVHFLINTAGYVITAHADTIINAADLATLGTTGVHKVGYDTYNGKSYVHIVRSYPYP